MDGLELGVDDGCLMSGGGPSLHPSLDREQDITPSVGRDTGIDLGL